MNRKFALSWLLNSLFIVVIFGIGIVLFLYTHLR